MHCPLSLRMAASELFRRESERLSRQRSSDKRSPAATLDLQPAFCVVEELLDRISLSQLRTIEDLGTLVRGRLEDEIFNSQAGDPVIDQRFEAHLEREVQLVLTIFEKLLLEQGRQGPVELSTHGNTHLDRKIW